MGEKIINDVEELIVIGNGFDRACGIETTYGNFFNAILEKNEEKKKISLEQKSIVESYEHILEECLKFLGKSSYFNYPREKFKCLPNNVGYIIFLFEKINENANWSNIEEVIYDYVENNCMIEYFSNHILSERKRLMKPTLLKGNLENIKTTKSEIFKLFFEKLNYTEDEQYNKIKNLKKTNEKISFENIQEEVTVFILAELHRLEKDFEDFIVDIINITYEKNVNNVLLKIWGEDRVSLGKREGESLPYNLLSFNYTTSVENTPWKRYQTFNVHGKAIGGLGNNIIFGIDDKNISAASYKYRFTKTYRILQLYSNNKAYFNINNIYSKKIKRIKFFGHSLASADYAYFQQMFDYYNIYNSELELIFYYSIYEEGKEEQIKQEQTLAISRLIEEYGATMNNKDHGKNLLIRLIQTQRLKLINIDEIKI